MSDPAIARHAEAPEDTHPPDRWAAQAARALGAEPALLVAARSLGEVPCRGPVMIAAGAGRLAVFPGSRERPPGDVPGTVVWLVDLLRPPVVRPRRRGAPSVALETVNARLRLAAPPVTLRAIVDAFTATVAQEIEPLEVVAPRPEPARPPLPPAASRPVPVGYELRDGVLAPLRRPSGGAT
jgi:hypothetical protein